MLQLRVEAIKWETADTATFLLSNITGEKVAYLAGQFITLIFSHRHTEIRRSYSLSSSPHEAYLSITVKRMENGEISRYLLTKTQVGDTWTVLEPAGKFTVTDYAEKKDIFYFAAGSGITPVYAQVKYILAHPGSSHIKLIYSSHNKQLTLFYDELNQLHQQYPDRLSIVYLFSESENHSPGKRLSNDMVTRLVTENLSFPADRTEFLICGPFTYMRMIRLTLTYLGFEPVQIRKENFVLETVPVVTERVTYPPKTIKLNFKGTTYDLPVGENQSILQAALQQDIHIPYSCKAGICSNCTAICRSGKVDMTVNDVLTNGDLKAGWVLTCTGHPVSNDVVIDFL